MSYERVTVKAYRDNRMPRQRLVVNLPPDLVRQVDEWGVGVGLASRRESTELLLREGLKAAGGDLAGQTPAAKSENAA